MTAEVTMMAVAMLLGISLLAYVAWHGLRALVGVLRGARPSDASPRETRDYYMAPSDPEIVVGPATQLAGWTPCVLCDEQPATEPWSIVEANRKQDRDWFGHRALHGLAPMYIIRDEPSGRPCVCKPHKRLVDRMLEEKLAEIRALNAKHAALVERRMAQLEMGELLALAQNEAAMARQTIEGVRSREIRELPPSHAGTVTLPPHHEPEDHEP